MRSTPRRLLRGIDHYRRGLFTAVRNQHSLWDRCAVVFDADHLTDGERSGVLSMFEAKSGYEKPPVFLWKAYTIEATILADRQNLGQIISSLIRQDTRAAAPPSTVSEVDREYESLRSRLTAGLNETAFLNKVNGQREQRFGDFERLIEVTTPATRPIDWDELTQTLR